MRRRNDGETHLGLTLAAFIARLLGAPVLERGGGAKEDAGAIWTGEGAGAIVVVLRTPGDVVWDEVPAVFGGESDV